MRHWSHQARTEIFFFFLLSEKETTYFVSKAKKSGWELARGGRLENKMKELKHGVGYIAEI